jgi:hypothetical protein
LEQKTLRLIGSALLAHLATSFLNQTFVSGLSARHRLQPSVVRCSEPLAIPTVLSSRTQPLEWKLRQLLNLSDGAPLQLAYIGTAGTAPRNDSDRPLKDQRKKRRYEARAQCRLLGEMFSASSARHIFLEDHHQDRGGGPEPPRCPCFFFHIHILHCTASEVQSSKMFMPGRVKLTTALKSALGTDGNGLLFVDGGNTFWLLCIKPDI